MSDYHSLSASLKGHMSAAKHAALQIDRSNSGSFATSKGLDQIRSAALAMREQAEAILAELPVEAKVDAVVLRFGRTG